MAKPRKRRRRRRIGAAVAIFFAFAIGIGVAWGADSVLWGALAGLGTGALGWGASLFFPGGEAVLADVLDDDDRGEGLSDDGGLGDA
jgi:MFS family permease